MASVVATTVVFAQRRDGGTEIENVHRSSRAITLCVTVVCLALIAIVVFIIWRAAQGQSVWS
jgi:hypothetical protein